MLYHPHAGQDPPEQNTTAGEVRQKDKIMSQDKATSLVRKEEEAAKEVVKGGSYIRLTGDLKDQFKALSKELGFDPENPRSDKAVKKVGAMVAAMGIELARACLATGTENLAEYTAKIKAEAEDQPNDTAEATTKE